MTNQDKYQAEKWTHQAPSVEGSKSEWEASKPAAATPWIWMTEAAANPNQHKHLHPDHAIYGHESPVIHHTHEGGDVDHVHQPAAAMQASETWRYDDCEADHGLPITNGQQTWTVNKEYSHPNELLAILNRLTAFVEKIAAYDPYVPPSGYTANPLATKWGREAREVLKS